MKGVSEFEELIEGNEVPSWSFIDEMSRYAFAARYVKSKVVLDIACGTAYGARYLLKKGAKQVVGGGRITGGFRDCKIAIKGGRSAFCLL